MATETVGKRIVAAIDKSWANDQGDGFRSHLGASILGDPCARKVWYSFRWVRKSKHIGRILRLFDRGHREETNIVAQLRRIGIEVSDRDPATGEQWRVSFSQGCGHVGGSGDGRAEDKTGKWFKGPALVEIKTHGEKSFKALVDKGLVSSKLGHYIQMQLYMAGMGLSQGIYVAINKNTDELFIDIVEARPETAEYYLDRADQIVHARKAPPRIHEDPTWWVCKMCDYHGICHGDEQPAKNCRSCVYAEAVDGGRWYCNQWKSEIPEDFLRAGCSTWEPVDG